MAKTSIEWTDVSWNPTAGCSLKSPGCTNCYAMRQARRLELMARGSGNAKILAKYQGLTKVVNGRSVWTGKLSIDDATLLEPLTWRTPRRVFVNSMSDLFHEDLEEAVINRVFAVMALCPQHMFQILTKRADRMRKYCSSILTPNNVDAAKCQIADQIITFMPNDVGEEDSGYFEHGFLKNVWLGVSVEDAPRAQRVEALLKTPAAVRFISYEPALESVDFCFRNWADIQRDDCRIDWIIVGGESGPGARPFHLDWARSIIDDARSAGVAVFIKQLGRNPIDMDINSLDATDGPLKLRDPAGGDMAEWPADLRVREFPGGMFPGALVSGVCRVCGCVDARACPGGCSWADAAHTLCSRCVKDVKFVDGRRKAARK